MIGSPMTRPRFRFGLQWLFGLASVGAFVCWRLMLAAPGSAFDPYFRIALAIAGFALLTYVAATPPRPARLDNSAELPTRGETTVDEQRARELERRQWPALVLFAILFIGAQLVDFVPREWQATCAAASILALVGSATFVVWTRCTQPESAP